MHILHIFIHIPTAYSMYAVCMYYVHTLIVNTYFVMYHYTLHTYTFCCMLCMLYVYSTLHTKEYLY
jgi:hypothetical protein